MLQYHSLSLVADPGVRGYNPFMPMVVICSNPFFCESSIPYSKVLYIAVSEIGSLTNYCSPIPDELKEVREPKQAKGKLNVLNNATNIGFISYLSRKQQLTVDAIHYNTIQYKHVPC